MKTVKVSLADKSWEFFVNVISACEDGDFFVVQQRFTEKIVKTRFPLVYITRVVEETEDVQSN